LTVVVVFLTVVVVFEVAVDFLEVAVVELVADATEEAATGCNAATPDTAPELAAAAVPQPELATKVSKSSSTPVRTTDSVAILGLTSSSSPSR